MPDVYAEDASSRAVSLPCPLPVRHPREPRELSDFRAAPADEKTFSKLRRTFRDAEDWRSLATLLLLHACAVEPADRNKAAEMCVQSYELWLERVKDRSEAAHALARAVQLKPDNHRAVDRLRKLYEALGSTRELVTLLRFVLASASGPEAAALHFELAELLEHNFLALGEAAPHYERALQLDPVGAATAGDRLVKLYLGAGAWQRAAALMRSLLERLDPVTDRTKVAELHRRLAAIESEQLGNVAAAARHLQAALKAVPDDIDALRTFGVLYLGSGKATDDGVAKAADIFYKAAELARRRGDKPRALKLLRRSLQLAPDHPQASQALENTLIDAEDWLALDELYREWLFHFSGPDAVPLLLRRADLLESRLHRREEARVLYEEASRYQSPDDESWRKLEHIYTESGDNHALAALLDAQIERMPDDVSVETLLRAAQVYRDELGNEERAAVYYYKVLEREPFNAVAFEGYKEHWRRKHNWAHLRDLVLYQIDQAAAYADDRNPPYDPKAFAEEFVELADICERRLGDIDAALDAWMRMQQAYPKDDRPDKQIQRIEKRARMWDNMVRVQEAELERAVDPAKRLDILKRLTQVYRDRQVNPERAIELHSEILELAPNDVQAARALTALYDRAGDFPRVIEMLRDQYDRTRSNTERVALLRRMAEIWHHELDSPDEAIWACEQVLELTPSDRDALVRLQQIYEEQQRYKELIDALERDLKGAGNADAKAKVLRRMARVAERDLEDDDRSALLWNQLLELRPGNLEIVDRLIALFERAERFEEMGTLLSKAATSPKTPLVRQVDYLLRLGQLAESSLDDPELARSSFERVVRSRPDHRGALEALVRLYRRDDAWQPLVAVLGKLQQLAETDEDAFRIAWERSEILGEQLDDFPAACEVLEQVGEDIALGRREVLTSLLDLYERSKLHRKVIRQAELILLAADTADDRRRLYEKISSTWLRQLGEKQAALAAYSRFVGEFSTDLEALWRMAELQEEVGDHEAALATLQRRLELATEIGMQTATLDHMADVAEKHLKDAPRALDFLRRALAIDFINEELAAKTRALAERHGLWRELLGVLEQRAAHMGEAGLPDDQRDLCLVASTIAEQKLREPPLAFEWARRAFFIGLEHELESQVAGETMRRIADAHKLWGELTGVLDHEVGVLEQREAPISEQVARLREAADIAERRLAQPEKAVGYLQRAHRIDPDDEELASKLQALAEKHKLWQAVIELWGGRLQRAATELGRFDACVAISRVYEEELKDAEQALGWLRQAWNDMRRADENLARDAHDRIVALSERHGLWPNLADYHLARAKIALDAGNGRDTLTGLREAARVFEERMKNPLAAMRVLATGLVHDPSNEVVLPEIRRLGQLVDTERGRDAPAVGALALLQVLQRLVARSRDTEEQIELVSERARVREQRLRDFGGAMAEWMRVLRLDAGDETAMGELERLAEEHDLWSLFLLVPASRLEEATATDDVVDLFKRIARLYEGPLSRPEYALRARLEAWRREPDLPPREGDIGDDHGALWRLADRTGAYHTPPVPRDPLLQPAALAPEIADIALWSRTGLDQRVLETLPSAFSPRLEAGAPLGVPSQTTEEVSLTELEPKRPDASAEILTDEEAADLEELDDVEFEQDEELEKTVTHVTDPEEGPTLTVALGKKRPAAPAPPPPPRTPDAGLPALPRLGRPILPPRPKVASAWEEVALAYTETAGSAPTRPQRAEIALVLARLWEEGAKNLERAFQALERALGWVPEMPEALAGLVGLAQRHGVPDRLLGAYDLLLRESALPEHVVAHSLRIAALHESRSDLPRAEERYRAVLTVVPTHREAVRALLRIYESQERWADYAGFHAELLEIESDELSVDERVERTMELCNLLETKLGRIKDAIERLELLVRELPDRREAHDALIRLLLQSRQWQHAIEAMRAAIDAVPDEQYRLDTLAKVAEVYEEKLGLAERAIGAWAEIADVHDDPQALAKLQQLYLDTGRFEPALPVIERRLGIVDPKNREERIALLVAKARVLQEGLGDSEAAMSTLEELVREAPQNVDVLIGLSRLYRKVGRFDEGVQLLRNRLEQEDDEHRRIRIAAALSDVLDRDAHDPRGAIAVVDGVLERNPGNPELLRLRARVARSLHDLPLLADSLAQLPDLDEVLEAADLLRGPVHDRARALRLYSRVLAETKGATDEPDGARRLAQALEGLVKLRVDDGDTHGAMEFMDRQLAEVRGPTIRAQLLTEMGRITYRSTGDVAAARKRFDAALAEDADYAKAKLGLGEVLLESGAVGEAEQLLEQAVDSLGLQGRSEHLVEALALLARVLEQGGRSGDAYRRLTIAARHDPQNLAIRAAIVRNRHAAARHRDAVTAAEQLEQRLADGFERTPKVALMLSDVMALVADSELQLKQPEEALARYRRAAEIDPTNPRALEPLIGLCQERGLLVEAARHSATLARGTTDDRVRGQRFLDAGMLFNDAAAAIADGAEAPAGETEGELRKAAFENIRMGLELVHDTAAPLDRGRLEVAFRACADHDPPTALRCLDRILASPELSLQKRHDLLLEGVQIALNADDRLDAGEAYAKLARELMPDSASAVLAQARVLEATDRVDEIEPLVEKFFAKLGRKPRGQEDADTRVALLLRLAELQRARPEKAIAALEHAEELDRKALGPDERRLLAELYEEADVTGDKVLANHVELLTVDPLHTTGLAALGQHFALSGDNARADALFRVLALVEPEHPLARQFLDTHVVAGGATGELVTDGMLPAPPPDGGVVEALVAVLEGAPALLADYLPKVEVPSDARISPLGDRALAQVWGETLKRLGQSKVALAAFDSVQAATADTPDGANDGGWFEIRCQSPPVILASRRAAQSSDEAALRFALGRALHLTRADAVLAVGLRRSTLASLVSALLQALHPRHGRRKHHQREGDFVARLSQELARKLPMKLSRQIGALFKDREEQPFDSRAWRAWARKCGNRVGLALCGDLGAAVRVVLAQDEVPSGDALRQLATENEDLRDLVAFAGSEAYAKARKQLGFDFKRA